MADKIVTLQDENNNNLYPTTSYNAVKDANGNVLPADFTNIGGGGDEGGEKIDVLYDMRSSDAAINRGWTTGMKTATVLRTDFSKYTSIRIFATINGFEAQQVLKVADRKNANTSMMAFDTTNYKSLNILKVILATLNTSFQVGGWATYAYDPNNNYSLTVTKSNSSNTNYYVYRLEGIY